MNCEYDPQVYWRSRYRPNVWGHRSLSSDESAWLRTHTQDAETIIDFGPGVGRTFFCYANKRVLGWDIVGRYTDACFQQAETHNIDYTAIIHPSPQVLTRFTGDVVVMSYLLLHEPSPGKYCTIARELAPKVVVLDTTEQEMEAKHCFVHDYTAIFTKNGWTVGEVEKKNSYYGVFYGN